MSRFQKDQTMFHLCVLTKMQTKRESSWVRERTWWKCLRVFIVELVQHLLCMFCSKDFFFFSKLFSGDQGHCVYWYTLVSKSIFQQVCHQKQLNWFVCLFVFLIMFAVFSLEKRDRHRATEQWVSNSSLSARLAYRASLIYFHFTSLKTVGSGYSNIFINLPR